LLNTDKRVLHAIKTLIASTDQDATPITYDQIAAIAIVSKNTVMYAVARLCEADALQVERNDSASPYRYHIPETSGVG